MKKSSKRIVTSVLLGAGILGTSVLLATRAAADGSGHEVVPVELVLLVDTSGSVNSTEYLLQKQGYEAAFRNSDLTQVIETQGGIAVTYVEWSNADHQAVRIDWTRLDTSADCWAFANQIADISREIEGETMLAPALEFAAQSILSNDYVGMKRVIDVSGDGRGENYDYYLTNTGMSAYHGRPWDDVLSDMAGAVQQVNGICITADSDVVDFYRDVLPQGHDAFMMQVNTFGEFEDAILEKLIREIGDLPGLYD